MNKSNKIMQRMTDEELRIILLVFSSKNVIEALRIYHCIPGAQKTAFIKAGREELEKRKLLLPGQDIKLLNKDSKDYG